MNPSSPPLKGLRLLAAVRERCVEQLAVEMAAKALERDRYRRNLERMAALGGQESSQGSTRQNDTEQAARSTSTDPDPGSNMATSRQAELSRRVHPPGSGTPTAVPLALARSMNASLYKQSLLRMAEAHRTDLALHEADMAVTQGALTQALGKREAIGQVLAGHLRRLVESEQRSDRKRQDELAGQWWLRTPGR